MIFKRAVAKLRGQDWTAIAIELAIVIVGVFIGTWVANWNQERLEKAETQRMVAQLGPTLAALNTYWPLAWKYYAVTRAYADVATAGWDRDPRVNDTQFVLAAYQASQIYVINLNGSAFSKILGEDRLAQIDDEILRADLSSLMTSDYTQIDLAALDTPYRRNVRRIIPINVQDVIRRKCGDRYVGNDLSALYLPASCRIDIPADLAASTAAALRAHPDLRDDLQGQMAATAAFLENIRPYQILTNRVAEKSRALTR